MEKPLRSSFVCKRSSGQSLLGTADRVVANMNVHRPSRLLVGAAVVLLCAAGPAFARSGQQKPPGAVRQQERAAQRAEARAAQNAQPARPMPAPNVQGRPGMAGEGRAAESQRHLAQWMEDHKNLSLPEMQRALQNEQGFREFPPQVAAEPAQHPWPPLLHGPAAARPHAERGRGFGAPVPQQRQQWDIAVQQLHAFQQPRRQVVLRAIIDLREMPPGQREAVIDSPASPASSPPTSAR